MPISSLFTITPVQIGNLANPSATPIDKPMDQPSIPPQKIYPAPNNPYLDFMKKSKEVQNQEIEKLKNKFVSAPKASTPAPAPAAAQPASSGNSQMLDGAKFLTNQVLQQQTQKVGHSACNAFYNLLGKYMAKDPTDHQYRQSWLDGYGATSCRAIAPVVISIGLNQALAPSQNSSNRS